MRFHSLRFRLILWFLSIEAVTLLVFSFLLYGLLSRNLYGHHDESLLISQKHLLSYLKPLADDHFKALPSEFLALRDAVEIRSKDGAVILSTKEFQDISPQFPLVSVEEQNHEFLSVETTSGVPVRILVTPIADGEYLLIQASMLGDIKNTLATLKIILAILIPSVLLATSFGGHLIASRALLPVEQITNRAREIQARNLDQLLDIKTSDIELRNLVTTLNEMMERLNRAFRSMQQFSLDAAHELKTPLTVMSGTVEVALNQDRSSSEYKEAMQTVLDEINRMIQIVNQLFLLSSFEAGNPDVNREPIDLSDLLHKIFELTQPLAEEKGIRTVFNADSKVRILGDPAQVSQVFINLVDNAVKFTPENGSIEISLHTQTGNATVTVTDTGIGVPSEELGNIFERFYQVDRARSGENRGVGLGLSIVQRIVEAHQGKISVVSKVGQGTTFSVTFPILMEPLA